MTILSPHKFDSLFSPVGFLQDPNSGLPLYQLEDFTRHSVGNDAAMIGVVGGTMT